MYGACRNPVVSQFTVNREAVHQAQLSPSANRNNSRSIIDFSSAFNMTLRTKKKKKLELNFFSLFL